MLGILLALTLTHHNDQSPYGWHMSCERWIQRSSEIQMDSKLDFQSKMNLIKYLRSKVPGDCSGIVT